MIKRLWYYSVRAYVNLGLNFFYREIIVKNASNIPRNEAVIFTANHQNAFLDAIVVACTNTRYGHFLVRADIFKKGWAIRMLNSLNMMPAYRIRDGWQSLGKNQETFDRCEKILADKNAVIIFPEGNHGAQRRLRNLSKGFSRIAFESIRKDPTRKVYIVPVGLNFTDIQAFRASVSVYYGKPVLANEYFSADDVASANRLKEEVASRLKKLITHVEDETRYDSVMATLEASSPNYLDPVDTNRRIDLIEKGETFPYKPTAKSGRSFFHSGLWIIGSLINAIPLFLWSSVRKKIKDPVFIGSMKFVFGIFVFPLYYILIFVVIYFMVEPFTAAFVFVALLFSLHLRSAIS